MEKSAYMHKSIQSGHWAGMREWKTYGRRLLDALFETIRNLANFRHQSLELSNGRCPGCDYITACGVSCLPELYPCSGTKVSYINIGVLRGSVYRHIGVGSDVVCSTLMGNDGPEAFQQMQEYAFVVDAVQEFLSGLFHAADKRGGLAAHRILEERPVSQQGVIILPYIIHSSKSSKRPFPL